jgi:hypothetical protein
MKLNIQVSIIALALLAIIGCKKVPNDSAILNINEYQIKSMLYPTSVMPDTNKIKLVYNKKDQIVQRIGNLIMINSATGYSYKYYKYIADTIMYYNDSIIIEKQLLSDEDITVFPYTYKRKLFLENDLIIKEINYMDYYSRDQDTIVYEYNKQNQVVQTITYLKNSKKKYSEYKYDEEKNLILITSKIYYEDYLEGDQLRYCDTTWFLNYDNSRNLTQNLFIFQECYYRSLSTNNFRKYIYKKYNASDYTLSLTEERNWEFEYNENNSPIY